MHDIDFVITYLDGNDPSWQEERNKYSAPANADAGANRYRDWDNLKYLFRGFERFTPWVRKIHFVTCGHVPSWLNTSHPKINIVRHSDYIPSQWLPTFSSRCIDMNLHRIKDLAEHFVYFNDDMFPVSPCGKNVFFKNGLPCDSAILEPSILKTRSCAGLYLSPLVGTALINKHFKKNRVILKNPLKWFNPVYGKFNIETLLLMPYSEFAGFRPIHLPYSYLKSSYKTVWKKEPELCSLASSHRFRVPDDLNHLIFSYWQFATGHFSPRSSSIGKGLYIRTVKDAKKAADILRHSKYKLICLNDNIDDASEAETIMEIVNGALEKLFPQRSSFELI